MAVNSALVLKVGFDKARYNVNEPIRISAVLSKTQAITNTSVTAILGPMLTGGLSPAAANLTLKLYDDGTHSDGSANDGVYANTWTETQWNASYSFQVLAIGTMPNGEKFARQVQSRVVVGNRLIATALVIDNTTFLPLITK